MNEETVQAIAAQLRQPGGEFGIQVGEKMNESNLHINLNTIDAVHPSANDRILEIGMGNGFFVKNIVAADLSIKYTGCDFSETMVHEARKLNQQFIENGQVQFEVAGADKLPFGDEIFNKIFTVNTIYFWDDAPLIFSEIRRVLKANGTLIIAIRPASIMQHYPFVKYGFRLFNREELAALLTSNGFRIISIVEKQEPDQEINGEKINVETLLACAVKED